MTPGEDVPRLSVELLEELKARWYELGAPIAEQLRPGLPEDQIDAAVAPLGLHVPSEARVWWGWHDGTTGATRAGEAFPGGWLNSLSVAVEQAQWERNEAVGLAGEQAETLLWRSSWLPIITDIGGDHIAVDCALPPELPSPVYYVDREGGAAKFEPRVPSIATMIRWWIDAIDAGINYYDTTAGGWRQDHKRLDPERVRTGLV